MQIIDMTPYEEDFTELERLYYERYMTTAVYKYVQEKNTFTDEEINRITQNYFNAIMSYDVFFNKFKQKLNIQGIDWNPDFVEREMQIS